MLPEGLNWHQLVGMAATAAPGHLDNLVQVPQDLGGISRAHHPPPSRWGGSSVTTNEQSGSPFKVTLTL